jgi:hypothetical protein
MKLAPSYWSAIAEDHRTSTFVALLAGFMEVSEPFESGTTLRKSVTSMQPYTKSH